MIRPKDNRNTISIRLGPGRVIRVYQDPWVTQYLAPLREMKATCHPGLQGRLLANVSLQPIQVSSEAGDVEDE